MREGREVSETGKLGREVTEEVREGGRRKRWMKGRAESERVWGGRR